MNTVTPGSLVVWPKGNHLGRFIRGYHDDHIVWNWSHDTVATVIAGPLPPSRDPVVTAERYSGREIAGSEWLLLLADGRLFLACSLRIKGKEIPSWHAI